MTHTVDGLVEKLDALLRKQDARRGWLHSEYRSNAIELAEALGLDGTNMLIQNWRDISEAPKDGTLLWLAKFDWVSVGPNNVWIDVCDREYTMWWCAKGFWSDKWGNWNDGIEPSGLAGPTHFIPLSEIPVPK